MTSRSKLFIGLFRRCLHPGLADRPQHSTAHAACRDQSTVTTAGRPTLTTYCSSAVRIEQTITVSVESDYSTGRNRFLR